MSHSNHAGWVEFEIGTMVVVHPSGGQPTANNHRRKVLVASSRVSNEASHGKLNYGIYVYTSDTTVKY
jgi:hypothetical protein